MPNTVADAIAHCRAQSEHGPAFGEGECQMQCRIAYGVPSDGTPSAIADWQKSKHRHGTADPAAIPRGALVRWSGGSHGYGHVAISAGDGMCWSTDIRRVGYFDRVPIAEIHDRWGLTLLGYTDDIDGVQVIRPRKKPAPKPKPSRGPNVTATDTAARKGASYARKHHQAQRLSLWQQIRALAKKLGAR